MTKKQLEAVTELLNALQYLQSEYSNYPMTWAVTEPDPGVMKMEIDCYFKTRAAQLLLLLDEFSALSTRMEEEVLTIQ